MNFSLVRIKRQLYSLLSKIANIAPLILLGVISIFLIFVTYKSTSYLKLINLKPSDTLAFFDDPLRHLENTNYQTNILLLGIRGFGDQGEDLTDTMLLISYDHQSKRISTLSIPRDIYINSLKTKINSVYHYGKLLAPDGGIKLTSAAVTESLGVPVHYSAVIDFNLFKNIIDLLGGVDINISRSFTDNKFPLPGKETALPISSRYEIISFTAGPNHLDSDMALKFIRSRYADGEEGTDIARNARQQLILDTIRREIQSPQFLLDRNKVANLFEIINKTVDTNISSKIYPSLLRVAWNGRGKVLNEIELNYQAANNQIAVLENPNPKNYQGQWVLIAKDNNWKALQQYIQIRLNGRQ